MGMRDGRGACFVSMGAEALATFTCESADGMRDGRGECSVSVGRKDLACSVAPAYQPIDASPINWCYYLLPIPLTTRGNFSC